MRCTPGFGPGSTVWLAVASIVDADAAGTAMRSAARASSDATRRGTGATLFTRDDVPYRPERLLDVYRRHAGHGDGEQDHLAGALGDPGVGADVVEQDGQRARLAGHHEPPARDPFSGLRGPQPQAALDGGGVQRPDRHARLHHGDRDRVVEQVAALEAAVLHALEHQRLDRHATLVGLQADVAEEDPVGLRDGLLPERDRLRSAEAVGEQPQPLAQLRRALARHEAERHRRQPQAGPLLGELGGDLTLDERWLAHRDPPLSVAGGRTLTAPAPCAAARAARAAQPP